MTFLIPSLICDPFQSTLILRVKEKNKNILYNTNLMLNRLLNCQKCISYIDINSKLRAEITLLSELFFVVLEHTLLKQLVIVADVTDW